MLVMIFSIIGVSTVLTFINAFFFHKESFKKNKKSFKITGKEICETILQEKNIDNFSISEHQSRNYVSFKKETIYLAEEVFNKKDVYALSIATHEVSHAIQMKEIRKYFLWRKYTGRIVSILAKALFPILLICYLFNHNVFFGKVLVCIFYISWFYTLVMVVPLEYSANKKAMNQLKKRKIAVNKYEKQFKRFFRIQILGYIVGSPIKMFLP